MLVHFNSAHRVNGQSHNDFHIRLDQPPDLPSKVKVSLVDAVIPQTWYNVAEGTTFEWNNGTDQSVSLAAGNYSDTEFKSEFEAKTGLTISFSDITQKVTITSSGAISIYWDRQAKIADLLGFKAVSSGSSPSHESDYSYNLSPNLYLHLDLGVPTCYTANGVTSTFMIPVYGNGGSFSSIAEPISVEMHSDIFYKAIRVCLLDEDGIKIPLKNNWAFTLAVN